MKNVVLIAEDNKTIRMYQKSTLEKLDIEVVSAEDLDGVKLLLNEYGKNIVLAIIDINLPNCEDCVLDFLLKRNIPSIAMTGSFHENLHEKIINKNVLDYIVLEDDKKLELLTSTVLRILHNKNNKILIVDDSKTSRISLKTFLVHQNFEILEASNGKQALELIQKHKDIKIALIDYEMPEMNGAELTRIIRKNYSRSDLAVLAISIHTAPLITVEFLKAGANDFITKPYVREEVNARIAVNLDMIEMQMIANSEIEKKKKAERELQELNVTLEKKVQEEIEKNRKKEQLLIEQSRMSEMGELIGMIAHQWRQPLSIISMNVNNMLVDIELDDLSKNELAEGLKSIADQDQYLAQTIDDFRNFYKANKKSVKITLENVVSKSLKIIKASLLNNNIKVIEEHNLQNDIEVYDSELMQVIINILKNAQDNFIEKQPKNSYIKITTTNNTITICDNGGGIPEDIIAKIFLPYFSTKIKKDGTGLGLYMSKTIIEEHHNGKLNVKNTNDGVCFKIEVGEIVEF